MSREKWGVLVVGATTTVWAGWLVYALEDDKVSVLSAPTYVAILLTILAGALIASSKSADAIPNRMSQKAGDESINLQAGRDATYRRGRDENEL